MEFLYEYGLFLAKAVTFVVAVGVVITMAVAAGMRGQSVEKGHIEVKKLNDKYDDMLNTVREAVLEPDVIKEEEKEKKKAEKEEKKRLKKAKKAQKPDPEDKSQNDVGDGGKKRVFIADFFGDVKASANDELREVVTAILSMARSSDEVILRLESQGGMVHSYGLASSQLARITAKNIPLTICVDKVAASGGYMMACVANKIVAAPFAVIGSIGVVAQLPNFHKVLKKHDIDYEMLTAGEYKRTLTMFGENTDKGRNKFLEDLEDTHVLFKEFIAKHREGVNLEEVATGEIWFGTRALENNLIDSVQTSDEYIFEKREDADLYEVEYVQKKTFPEKLGLNIEAGIERVLTNLWFKASRQSKLG